MMELRRSCELIFVRNVGDHEEVLLGKRGPDRHGAGTWALFGGHVGDLPINQDESIDEAGEREAREEVGDGLGDAFRAALKLGHFTVIIVDDRRADATPPVHYIHTAYVIEVPAEAQANNMEPNLCTELRWFPRSNLPLNTFYPPHSAVIGCYINGRQYDSVSGLM